MPWTMSHICLATPKRERKQRCLERRVEEALSGSEGVNYERS